ncbi:MAG TPA: hypothetical protein VK610_01805 [Rhodothermales bacterium]|nr:hypothetical protein [Rhodothermales bacterium]
MSEPHGITVPALPCVSLDDSLAFWQTLGFTVKFTQRAPNPYAVIARDGYELHLFGLKGLIPENNFTTCLVLLPEVERLHATFAAGLQAALGRAPYRGLPRLSRMRPGQTRFTVTDVAGNSVIFIRHSAADQEAAERYKQAGLAPFEKATALAARMRDFKNDEAGAARVLDMALAKHAPEASLAYARALIARIELAVLLGEPTDALDARLRGVTLPEPDAATLAREVEALDTLRRTLAP